MFVPFIPWQVQQVHYPHFFRCVWHWIIRHGCNRLVFGVEHAVWTRINKSERTGVHSWLVELFFDLMIGAQGFDMA